MVPGRFVNFTHYFQLQIIIFEKSVLSKFKSHVSKILSIVLNAKSHTYFPRKMR
jgi:hypothetical protein